MTKSCTDDAVGLYKYMNTRARRCPVRPILLEGAYVDFPWTRVATGISLLWSAVAVVIVTVTLALTAHEDLMQKSGPSAPVVAAIPTAEPSRPRGVPIDAVLITDDTVLGAVSTLEATPADAPHLFFWLTCDDRLLTIATTRETIYAELDCGRYWLVHEVVRPYQGQPVRVQIGAGPEATLIVEATAAGAARFDVDAVWVQSR